MARAGTVAAAVVTNLVLLAAVAHAQEAGIAGVVRDATGAVLPGVTVTATSPVLIEQQRTATTDAAGRYVITPLRPGIYKVEFTLTGFGTTVRDGINLTSGLTANVEAELRVGGVQENVTVTGASPVVDVQNVRRQQVVTSDLLDALPVSSKSISSPGLAHDRAVRHRRRGRPVPGGAGQRRGVGRRRFPWQVGHQSVVRRHGHGEQLGQQQLPAHGVIRRRDGDVDQRHLGRHERRRRRGEHHPEGRQQHLQNDARRPVLQ